MAGFDSKAFGEKLKAEITEQTKMIMRKMLVESRREERQELLVPQTCPFDLKAEDSRRWQLEDDQETLLVEPVARPRVDVPEQTKKLDWAKDLAKSMAQM